MKIYRIFVIGRTFSNDEPHYVISESKNISIYEPLFIGKKQFEIKKIDKINYFTYQLLVDDPLFI